MEPEARNSAVAWHWNTHILDIAKINGFKEKTVKKKIEKFKRMKSIHEISTLSSESTKKTYMRIKYHPWMFNKLNKVS